MGLAFDIIGIVIKSVFSNKIESELGNDLVGVPIDVALEKSANVINDFVNSETSKIKQVLSRENMKSMNISEDRIDFVTAEIKALLLKVKITEEVFRQCEYSDKSLEEYLWNEYSKSKNGYMEHESDIKKGFRAVAKVLITLKDKSDDFEKKLLTDISGSVNDTNKELHKISAYLEGRFGSLDKDNQELLDILRKILEQVQISNIQNENKRDIVNQNIEFPNNKKQDYIKIWNSRLFLHIDNDERPITLADAFIMPDFKIHQQISRIGFSSNDTLDKIIEKFIEYDKTSTMLITGVPGIGKTSITSWIANEYKEDDRFIILRFRDWESEELEGGLLNTICNTLKFRRKDLDNKIFVLDGFDEMKSLDIRKRLLSTFFNDLKDFDNFKCIVTSRPDYIDLYHFHNAFELKEFDINKVDIFCRRIIGNDLDKKEKIESNLEVLGIPVILYMAIMSKIDISENPTKPELYEQIFSEKGGIFDRFSDGEVGYSKGAQVMRNQENIKKYLEFLRKVSFDMFEKKKLTLYEGEYEVPELEFQGYFVSILEFPIKHLFENVKARMEFIHKSIYEYFVAEYICTQICKEINKPKEIEEQIKNLAGVFGELLRAGNLNEEICEFLKYKIESGELNEKFSIVKEVFQLMLQDGMTYYSDKHYKNIVKCEMNVFANMLEIIHLWKADSDNLQFDDVIYTYLCYQNYNLNLKKVDFCEANLMEIFLSGADLEGANLRKANLMNADLRNANLIEANLINADLKGVNLIKADLMKADLKGADLMKADLRSANLMNADLKGVNLIKADLMNADLKGANLMNADLRSANLIRADLINADLRGTNLMNADLEYADLRSANLTEAGLRGADLTEANLRNTNLENSTWYKDDIPKILPQLTEADFTYIIIEEQGEKKKLYKIELFPNEK